MGYFRYLIASTFLMFSTVITFAQDADFVVKPEVTGSTLLSFIEKVESQSTLQFYYSDPSVEQYLLPKTDKEIPLRIYLEEAFKSLGGQAIMRNESQIFITSETTFSSSIDQTVYQTRKEVAEVSLEGEKKINTFLQTRSDYIAKEIIVGTLKQGVNESVSTLAGNITSSADQEPVIGATMIIEESGNGTSTDVDGSFSLSIPKGKWTLKLSSINFKEERIQIEVKSSGNFNFVLNPEVVMIDEITITSQRYDQVQNTQMGVERITTQSIKEIPLVLGESDILKVSTMLPGVQSVGEGAAGFNVRGSPADQNLFYIDKIPVYSTSHVFGFFSAFNSDAVSEFTLSKSNIPAKFGGRLASIFDVTAKEGDTESFKFNGGVSPVTGRLVVEGPILKDKLSFIVSARTTYSNYLLKRIKNPDFNRSNVFFGDGSIKLTYKVNNKNRINLFGYTSLDDIDFAGKSAFENSNKGLAASWLHRFSDTHNFDLNMVYSSYHLNVVNNESPLSAYKQNSGIAHTELRYDGRILYKERHTFTYGGDSKLYNVDLGNIDPTAEQSKIVGLQFGEEKGWESGIYFSDEFNLNSRLDLIAGIRLNHYQYLGPNQVYTYQENVEKSFNSIIDSTDYASNQTIASHTNLDYRIAAKFAFSPTFSLKGSFNTLHQYIFLLSNTIALSPNDRWKLTDNNISPMSGQQFSLGAYNKIGDQLEISTEAYVKRVDNLVEFKDGANLLISKYPEQDILQGGLDAYGIEFMIKKMKGKFNGWLNYTYSSSSILVDNGFEGGSINFGERYNANFDKPHALNLTANYKIKKRLSLSANVIYATGKPITYPTIAYEQNEIRLINYTLRNGYRVPDYFRVDLSLKLEGNLKSKKLIHGNWVFSIYNLTGRKNAYNIFFQNNGNSILGYKVSIFAQPIFSATYNFKFGNYDN